MTAYTVIGLADLETQPPKLHVAAVLEGQHDCVDTDPGTPCGLQRYATHVEARDSEEAEHAAPLDARGSSERRRRRNPLTSLDATLPNK